MFPHFFFATQSQLDLRPSPTHQGFSSNIWHCHDQAALTNNQNHRLFIPVLKVYVEQSKYKLLSLTFYQPPKLTPDAWAAPGKSDGQGEQEEQEEIPLCPTQKQNFSHHKWIPKGPGRKKQCEPREWEHAWRRRELITQCGQTFLLGPSFNDNGIKAVILREYRESTHMLHMGHGKTINRKWKAEHSPSSSLSASILCSCIMPAYSGPHPI